MIRRLKRIPPLAIAAVLILAIPLAATIPWLVDGLRSPAHGPPRAVIVDQLGLTDPNPAFVQEATRVLETDGYAVDYIAQESVDVELYRVLPQLDYDLIILRSHSAQFGYDERPGEAPLYRGIALFTNEPYQQANHIREQRDLQLTVAFYPQAQAAGRFFSIEPQFVESAMRGQFRGSTIILMGCAGLSSDDLARAFIGRGASRFVSWDRDVTAAHTDKATESLIQHFVGANLPIDAAVDSANADAGPDPAFGARLLVYPPLPGAPARQ